MDRPIPVSRRAFCVAKCMTPLPGGLGESPATQASSQRTGSCGILTDDVESRNIRREADPLGVCSSINDKPAIPQKCGCASGIGLGYRQPLLFTARRSFRRGYGHTGFTGASLWIHPQSETFVIILTNRVHPDGKGNVTHLRAVIANIVAGAISDIQ